MQNLPNNIFHSIHDFIIADNNKPLGSGSFGIVKKACHKMTGKIYAIKIVQLDQNMDQPQMMLLSRQISIHYQLNHPHIVKLWAVLEENDKIYMVLDYAESGNLFNYLNKKKIMTEAQSYKIFYQVLDAIQYLHKIDVFHRDIKPENILLDAQLNVKLCDFGWVADEIHRKRTTFCGTYQYMAPQMIQDVPYNYKIDIWALGILLYELTHGHAPFPASSAAAIKQKFQKGVYEIKETMSDQFKSLIVGILQFDPTKRFEIPDIKKSEWVKKFKNLYSANALTTSINRNCQVNRKSKGQMQTTSTTKMTSKDDKFVDQNNKHKKYRKKYKTLEQQDICCLTQNLKLSKHASIKDFQKFAQTQNLKQSSTLKQKLLKQTYASINSKQNITNHQKTAHNNHIAHHHRHNSNLNLNLNRDQKQKQKQKQQQKQRKQQHRKKKVGSTRTHTRTGTQTSQLLHKKLSKIVFQEKLRFYQDDRKKKIGSRRN